MRAGRGFFLFFINTAFAKSLTFIAQLVLGWLLVPEDFGLYAIVVSVGMFVGIIRNGGTEQILIQKGSDLDRLFPTAYIQGFIFNILAAAILFFISFYVADIYKDERLKHLLQIMSLVFPLGTMACFYRVKLSVDRKYKELATLRTASASIRQISLVIFALLGFGVYSFVIPMIIEVLSESVLGRVYTRWKPVIIGYKWEYSIELLESSRWVILGSLVLGFSMTGDYFILGLMLPLDQLGVYFFGVQLVVSVATIFSTAIQNVMLPALVSSANDSVVFARKYGEALTKMFFVSFASGVFLAVLSGQLIHVIWNGKWDMASPIAEVMFISMPFWLMVYLGRSGMEALGLWKERLKHLGVYALAGTASAVIVAFLTLNIAYVALGVALARAFIGIRQTLFVFMKLKQSYVKYLKDICISMAIPLVAGAISMLASARYFGGASMSNIVLTILVFMIAYLIMVRIFQYSMILSILKMIRR